MKKRTVLIPISLISLIFLITSGLSAYNARATLDTFVYLPMVAYISDQLFFDDFSDDSSGWPIDDDGNVKWSYQQGEYEMLIRTAGWWAGARAPIGGLDEYSVEADMRRLEGNTSDYGLVFDWQDWDNFYYLTVDAGDRWFGVARVVNGAPAIVIPRTETAVIKQGMATNHLKVDRKGSEIVVSINGEQLASGNDSTFGGVPSVGLYMEADEDAPARVRYDNFEVRWLGNGKTAGLEMSLAASHFSGEDDFSAALNWDTEE